jgi:hypothetical protein
MTATIVFGVIAVVLFAAPQACKPGKSLFD